MQIRKKVLVWRRNKYSTQVTELRFYFC